MSSDLKVLKQKVNDAVKELQDAERAYHSAVMKLLEQEGEDGVSPEERWRMHMLLMGQPPPPNCPPPPEDVFVLVPRPTPPPPDFPPPDEGNVALGVCLIGESTVPLQILQN